MTILRLFLVMLFISSAVHSVVGADLLVSGDAEQVEAPPVVETQDWGGFYLGLQGSYNWIKAGVEGVQNGPGHRYAKVRLKEFRSIKAHNGNRIADSNAALSQGRG